MGPILDAPGRIVGQIEAVIHPDANPERTTGHYRGIDERQPGNRHHVSGRSQARRKILQTQFLVL
jgi:hypothetical protein